jgi:ankyrin repeat protein
MCNVGAVDINEKDKLMCCVSRYGHLQVVKYLVSQGANVHAYANYAVRLASENGHLKVVKYLVSQETDIQANNNQAVRWASEYGHLEVVKFLVSQGAEL